MDNVPFKETIRNRLIESAKKYYSLINKKIIISSECFTMKKEYIIRFYETNFLHLTGVKTFLSPFEFYKKCFDGNISCDDFDCESTTQLKGLVRLKMRNMINIDSFFINEKKFKKILKKDQLNVYLALVIINVQLDLLTLNIA